MKPSPPINQFQGEYRFLSNFWPCNITIVGTPYKSVEAAYQASKTTDMNMRKSFSELSPRDAKKRGKLIPLRASWGDALKVEIMENCLRAKFAIPELKRRLISTGNAELVEGNVWNDEFWGVCRGKGRNVMGQLLMMIRDEAIIHEAQYATPTAFTDDNDDIPF